jgi:hypothetical protein
MENRNHRLVDCPIAQEITTMIVSPPRGFCRLCGGAMVDDPDFVGYERHEIWSNFAVTTEFI